MHTEIISEIYFIYDPNKAKSLFNNSKYSYRKLSIMKHENIIESIHYKDIDTIKYITQSQCGYCIKFKMHCEKCYLFKKHKIKCIYLNSYKEFDYSENKEELKKYYKQWLIDLGLYKNLSKKHKKLLNE